MRGCWENTKQLCITTQNSPTPRCVCRGLISSLVQILFSFASNSLSYILPYPKTKENKIYTKDKIEPQHVHLQNLPLHACKLKTFLKFLLSWLAHVTTVFTYSHTSTPLESESVHYLSYFIKLHCFKVSTKCALSIGCTFCLFLILFKTLQQSTWEVLDHFNTKATVWTFPTLHYQKFHTDCLYKGGSNVIMTKRNCVAI